MVETMGKYVVGLDGGGTKTEVIVADLDGNILKQFKSGAININGESIQNVEHNLVEIFNTISLLTGNFDDCMSTCIGAAGVSNPLTKETLKKAVAKSGYNGKLFITGDHETALYGALGKAYGIILIAGTGSICYGKNKFGLEKRTGGFGHLIDDEGSGYAIGRDILSALVRAVDGRGKETPLRELVFSQLNIYSINELIGFIYDKNTNKRDIAKLAPNLTLACADGDPVALKIAQKCSDELAGLVVPIANQLGLCNDEIALAGSVLQKDEYIRNSFVDSLARKYPKMKWTFPLNGAAYGAALMAIEFSNRV